jgi:hypothetical protein
MDERTDNSNPLSAYLFAQDFLPAGSALLALQEVSRKRMEAFFLSLILLSVFIQTVSLMPR